MKVKLWLGLVFVFLMSGCVKKQSNEDILSMEELESVSAPISVGRSGEIGFTEKVGGCGNFLVYAYEEGYRRALVVNVEKQNFDYVIGERILLDLGDENLAVGVRVEKFADIAPTKYCDDVGGDPEVIDEWIPVSGKLGLLIGEKQVQSDGYKVSIELVDVVLRDRDGGKLELKNVEYRDIEVGWLPG